MKIRNRFTLAAPFFVLLVMVLGITTVQAQGFYWRFTTPLPTVTCNEGGTFQIDIGNSTIDYYLPTPPAAITSAYQNANGGAWIFEGADPFPSLSGSGTRVIIPSSFPVVSFPWTIGLRLDTSINGQVIYRSILTLSCADVGTGTASLANGVLTSGGSAISDGRINPENYAPVALYCDGSVLTAYAIDAAGGTFDWSFDLSKTSANNPLISQMGISLSKTPDGRYDVLAPQHDGKQYLFVFDGCPSPGATEVYISDPVTGQFVRTD